MRCFTQLTRPGTWRTTLLGPVTRPSPAPYKWVTPRLSARGYESYIQTVRGYGYRFAAPTPPSAVPTLSPIPTLVPISASTD